MVKIGDVKKIGGLRYRLLEITKTKRDALRYAAKMRSITKREYLVRVIPVKDGYAVYVSHKGVSPRAQAAVMADRYLGWG